MYDMIMLDLLTHVHKSINIIALTVVFVILLLLLLIMSLISDSNSGLNTANSIAVVI